MTAQEAISNLRAMGAFDSTGACDPVECFLYLANHTYELRLASGAKLNDGTDFEAFLGELTLAFGQPGQIAAVPPQKRWSERTIENKNLTCPHCRHVHQGIGECGFPVGGGRVCHCEMEVAA